MARSASDGPTGPRALSTAAAIAGSAPDAPSFIADTSCSCRRVASGGREELPSVGGANVTGRKS